MPERVPNTRLARLVSMGKHRINNIDELTLLASVLCPDSKSQYELHRLRFEHGDGKYYIENWIENDDLPEYRRMRRDLYWEKELDGEIGKIVRIIA